MYDVIRPQIRIGDEQSKVLAVIKNCYPKSQVKNNELRINEAGLVLTFSEETLEKIERM